MKNTSIKKVALFGGSFDPITIAHLQVIKSLIKIASEVYNQFDDIEEVWLIPCGDSRSDKELTLGIHRVEMIKLILNDSLFSDVPLKVYLNILT